MTRTPGSPSDPRSSADGSGDDDARPEPARRSRPRRVLGRRGAGLAGRRDLLRVPGPGRTDPRVVRLPGVDHHARRGRRGRRGAPGGLALADLLRSSGPHPGAGDLAGRHGADDLGQARAWRDVERGARGQAAAQAAHQRAVRRHQASHLHRATGHDARLPAARRGRAVGRGLPRVPRGPGVQDPHRGTAHAGRVPRRLPALPAPGAPAGTRPAPGRRAHAGQQLGDHPATCPRPGRSVLTVFMLTGHLRKAGISDMPHYSVWVSYSGTARVVLALVLLIAAGGAAYAGTRLPRPVRAPRPGQKAANFMLAAWIAAMTAFLGCVGFIGQQARRDHLPNARPPDPITPVTLTAVAAIF